ncbi:MAG: DinB family protein [Candidatus Sulfotelmatobacter sp.]
MRRTLSAICLFLFTSGAGPDAAQLQQVHPFRDGTPGVTGYRSEVLALVMIQENEFLRLAEAFPAEKYTWRPAPGVKSVAEVFLHVSAANYNMYKLVGAPVPAGLDVAGMEQSTTDKTKVIATLRASYAHAKQAITDMPDANLEKTMDWLGGTITQRGVLLYIVPHIAEHLGQAIAYARINGIVPPWSEDPPQKK